MVNASDLRAGMVVIIDGEPFRVIEAEFRFRPEERLEDTILEKHNMEFLYSDADSATFMDPQTFEQVTVPISTIGPGHIFLKPEMTIPVEFYNGRPVSIILPETVDLRVETTAAPAHQQQ